MENVKGTLDLFSIASDEYEEIENFIINQHPELINVLNEFVNVCADMYPDSIIQLESFIHDPQGHDLLAFVLTEKEYKAAVQKRDEICDWYLENLTGKEQRLFTFDIRFVR
jgi:hypothetical protein